MITVGTDTYAALSEADCYFQSTLKCEKWAGLSEETKEICLKMACKKLEIVDFVGDKEDDNQILQFPKTYGIPQEIKDGQCELALWMDLNKDNQALNLKQMGLKSLSLGSESYSFDGTHQNIMCPETLEYISKYVQVGYKLC